MKYKTLVFDAPHLAWKQYFKMPLLTSKKGVGTSIIYGVLSSMNAKYKKYPTEYVYVCWEGREDLRKVIDPTYKVREKKDDPNIEEFFRQVNVLQEELPQLGIQSIAVKGYESDDCLAVLAHKEELQPVLLVSGDEDMYACLTESVDLLFNDKLINIDVFENNFKFPVYLYPIFKAITGCGSDKVKGVKGWGDKTAKDIFKLCNNDIDKILQFIVDKGKKEEFLHALKLTTLPYDWNYDLPIKIQKTNIDRNKLDDFFYKLNINAIHAHSFLQN